VRETERELARGRATNERGEREGEGERERESARARARRSSGSGFRFRHYAHPGSDLFYVLKRLGPEFRSRFRV